MQRAQYDTVTLATLIPAHPENSEGRAFVPVENTDEDGRPEISYTLKPVRKFTNADLQRDKRGAQTLKQIPKYKQLLALIGGLRAERDGDEVAASNAYMEYAKLLGSPLHESMVRQ